MWVLVDHTRQWIKMLPLVYVEVMSLQRSTQLHCLEIIISACGRKNREAIGRRAYLITQVRFNSCCVAFKAQQLERLWSERFGLRFKLLTNERLEIIASVLVRLQVQVKADEWISSRLEMCQLIQVIYKH